MRILIKLFHNSIIYPGNKSSNLLHLLVVGNITFYLVFISGVARVVER